MERGEGNGVCCLVCDQKIGSCKENVILLRSLSPKPMQQPTKNNISLNCTKLTGKISEIFNLHCNYHVFPFVTKQLLIKNACIASLGHALNSNQGTQVLPRCRGSHLCAWVAGPRVNVFMSAMIVLIQQFHGNPIVGQNRCWQDKKILQTCSIFCCAISYNLPRPIN